MVGDDELCRQLDIPMDSQVHSYSRLCCLGITPAFVERECVSAERFPNLWKHDIAQPILPLFDRIYGVRSVRDHVVITQREFSEDTTQQLALEPRTSGLVLAQTVFDDQDRPISFGHQYWRGDMARFSAELTY